MLSFMGVSIVRRPAGRYLALAALLLATPAAADGLMRWRTPNGGLYVGDTPPPGSTFIERTARPDAADPGSADAAPDEAAAYDEATHGEGEPAEPSLDGSMDEASMDADDAAPADAAPAAEPVEAVAKKAPKALSPDEIEQINYQLQGSADAVGGGRAPMVPTVPGQP